MDDANYPKYPEQGLAVPQAAEEEKSHGAADVNPSDQSDDEADADGEINILADSVKVDEAKQATKNDNEVSNDQLEAFRHEWQAELQQRPNSREASPRNVNDNVSSTRRRNNDSRQAIDVEDQARSYFLQGMDSEDAGFLNEAIHYYRKALQLVPDIESRLGNIFNRSPRERVRQDSESSVDGNETDEEIVINLDKIKMEDEGLCQPEYEQRASHISCLPVELIIFILQWVVSNELDLRSLEMFSMVCKGFYMCARDERVWKMACTRVWGINLGSAKKFGGSWRRMMIERPHLLFDGCYISKVRYVRQGEQGMDNFYRPFHLVEYFRYVRFFPDGHVLMLVSPEDPLQSLPKLKHRNSRAAGILRGGYKFSDKKVTCVLKRVKVESSNMNYRYKRHRQQAANQNEVEATYLVEFDLVSSGRRTNAQLVWGSYAIRSVYKSTGEEVVNRFDLNNRTFPPLIFSRVRSYTANSMEPLA